MVRNLYPWYHEISKTRKGRLHKVSALFYICAGIMDPAGFGMFSYFAKSAYKRSKPVQFPPYFSIAERNVRITFNGSPYYTAVAEDRIASIAWYPHP